MTNKNRTELFGILLVRSEPFQVIGGAATAVVQQDGGEWTAALRAPKHRV